jgi:hypothetical protein
MPVVVLPCRSVLGTGCEQAAAATATSEGSGRQGRQRHLARARSLENACHLAAVGRPEKHLLHRHHGNSPALDRSGRHDHHAVDFQEAHGPAPARPRPRRRRPGGAGPRGGQRRHRLILQWRRVLLRRVVPLAGEDGIEQAGESRAGDAGFLARLAFSVA